MPKSKCSLGLVEFLNDAILRSTFDQFVSVLGLVEFLNDAILYLS